MLVLHVDVDRADRAAIVGSSTSTNQLKPGCDEVPGSGMDMTGNDDGARTVARRTVAHQGNEKADSCSPL